MATVTIGSNHAATFPLRVMPPHPLAGIVIIRSGLNYGVDLGFWQAWTSQNRDSQLLRDKTIYVQGRL